MEVEYALNFHGYEARCAPRGSWMLKEKDEFTNDVKEYRQHKRRALLSILEDMQIGDVHLSRRVIGIWAYQRGELKRIG